MTKIPRNDRRCAGLQDRYATCVHSRLDARLKEARQKSCDYVTAHMDQNAQEKPLENTTKCTFRSKHGGRR